MAFRALLYSTFAAVVVVLVERSGASTATKLAVLICVPLLMIPLVVLMLRSTVSYLRGIADSDGISLRIDQEGVYLGSAHPRRIEWSKIKRVELSTHVDANSTADPDISPMSFHVTFIPTSPKQSDGLSRSIHHTDVERIETAVHRHAPRIPVRHSFHSS